MSEDQETHRYPRQHSRVGVTGYKGHVDVFDDPDVEAREEARKERHVSEDKARTPKHSK